jgi:hypothetical protein
MKKGPNKQTLNNYLSCFTEIKKGLDENPRVKLSVYADRFKIGKQPITVLKNTGVITKHGRGHKWTGPEPSFQMILSVLELIRLYHLDLKKRKSEQGELFKPSPKKRHTKGTQQPNFVNPEYDKQQIEVWQRNYKKQRPEITNVPIQTFDRSTASEFVETTEYVKQFKPDQKEIQNQINRAVLKNLFTAGAKFITNLFKRKK